MNVVPQSIQLDDYTLKREFSVALTKLFESSIKSREIVKDEALRKINYDYDVLYLLIKDREIENGKSFEDALSEFISIDTLKFIEQYYPTLTIFVPTLPNGYFSAEKWNTTNEVPAVAYLSSKETKEVPILSIENKEIKEMSIKANEVPALPVVVIKDNETIVAANNSNLKSNNLSKIGNTQLSFIDETFDNYNKKLITKSRGPSEPKPTSPEYADPTIKYKKILEAYDTFGVAGSGWQRDYIYYNLSNSTTRGRIDATQMEYLTAFKILHDKVGFDKISDQDEDPKPLGEWGNGPRGQPNPQWTKGNFEFKISVHLGTKSPVGSILQKYIIVDPQKIFELKYKCKTSGYCYGSTQILESVKSLMYYLPEPLALFEWNLENYSPQIKITIEEVDLSETQTSTFTNTIEFATNFEFNASVGEKEKVGFKFGASIKDTKTNTFTVVRNFASDVLGETIINFGDPVIISKDNANSMYSFHPFYNTKYTTGWCQIYIAPFNSYQNLLQQ